MVWSTSWLTVLSCIDKTRYLELGCYCLVSINDRQMVEARLQIWRYYPSG